MYAPILRSKQYELILLRENAAGIATNPVLPIIEPVNDQLKPLRRACDALASDNAEFCVIQNPRIGKFANDNTPLVDFCRELSESAENFSPGICVDSATSEEDLNQALETPNITILHRQQLDSEDLIQTAAMSPSVAANVFEEEQCGKLYRKQYAESAARRILIRDGFHQRRNADYDEHEHFSDLHATFEDEGMEGFGDYLVIGAPFADGGGPAYVVVIHLTYIDAKEDMHICHFSSGPSDNPQDPGGKFLVALEHCVEAIRNGTYAIPGTAAVEELQDLHQRGHYPGLGYLKKLSMQHHLEVITDYLAEPE